MTIRLLMVAAAVAACGAADAQGSIPRTAEGHPDFQGIWESLWLTPLERQADVPGDIPDSDVERVRQMGDELGGEVYMRQSNLHRAGDLDRLDRITCPTLVIAGEKDRLRSIAESEELRDGIPGATMTIMQGVGHMMPMEAPEALSRIVIDWWRGLGIEG